MSDTNKFLLLGVLVVCGWLVMELSSVLTPFFIAALFAYLGDPLVDKLEKYRMSRTVAVCAVFGMFLLTALILLLIFIPMLSAQLVSLFEKLPNYLDRLQTSMELLLQRVGLSSDILNFNTIKTALQDYWSEAGKIATNLVGYMSRSGLAILQWLTNLVLIPVLTFYLLRDWDDIVVKFRELLPRDKEDKITQIAIECDDMLAGFLRGQLMVMLALAIIYSIGLTFIGLDLALLLGVVAGIVSFVPYLGLVVGIVLAGLAAIYSFRSGYRYYWWFWYLVLLKPSRACS